MFPLIRLDETDSTNNYLKKLLANTKLSEYTVVCADFQTTGRGQRDSDGWESQRGKNLLCSLVLYPQEVEVEQQFVISQIVALAIKNVLDEYTADITIKWPNDIYWKDKKICGILIENSLIDDKIAQSVVGVGLNLNQQEFQSKAPNPVSLSQITGQEYDRDSILSSIVEKIKHYYLALTSGGQQSIHKNYKASLFRNEGYHSYRDDKGDFEACIKDISSMGYLTLEDKNHTIRQYAFKEVKYIL